MPRKKRRTMGSSVAWPKKELLGTAHADLEAIFKSKYAERLKQLLASTPKPDEQGLSELHREAVDYAHNWGFRGSGRISEKRSGKDRRAVPRSSSIERRYPIPSISASPQPSDTPLFSFAKDSFASLKEIVKKHGKDNPDAVHAHFLNLFKRSFQLGLEYRAYTEAMETKRLQEQAERERRGGSDYQAPSGYA